MMKIAYVRKISIQVHAISCYWLLVHGCNRTSVNFIDRILVDVKVLVHLHSGSSGWAVGQQVKRSSWIGGISI